MGLVSDINSPYLLYEWPENVTIFNGELGMFSYDNINIYGIENIVFVKNNVATF